MENTKIEKSIKQDKEIIFKRKIRRKKLLKELYDEYFESNGFYQTISIKGYLDGEDFEKFVDYTVLEELGYVYLTYADRDKIIKPSNSYSVSITPKGILAHEEF